LNEIERTPNCTTSESCEPLLELTVMLAECSAGDDVHHSATPPVSGMLTLTELLPAAGIAVALAVPCPPRLPVSNDIAGILRRMQPRCQRYRGCSPSGLMT